MRAEFLKRLDVQWHIRHTKIDWLMYETFIHDLFYSELTCDEKIALAKEALDAWTKRGHFMHQYLENYAD